MEDLFYNGTQLTWSGHGVFKATSGMTGYQLPELQCTPERGPVPEGHYYVPLIVGGKAEDDGSGICQLKPSWQLQKIPRGADAGICEPYWANWGKNRIRIVPGDPVTKNKCKPHRGGFYLHDSTKGYSHGCIEVEQRFFDVLRRFIRHTKKKKLLLRIQYKSGLTTNGGTKK